MSAFLKLLGAAAVVAGAAYAGKKFIDKHNVEVNITPAEEEGCENNVCFDDEEIPADEDIVFSEAPISSEYTYSIGKHVTVHVENPVETEDYEDVPEEEIEIEFTEEAPVNPQEAVAEEPKNPECPPAEDAEAAEEV